MNPYILLLCMGIVLLLAVLSYTFTHVDCCRRFVPLCRFMLVGIIAGYIIGTIGHLGYDAIERQLLQRGANPFYREPY